MSDANKLFEEFKKNVDPKRLEGIDTEKLLVMSTRMVDYLDRNKATKKLNELHGNTHHLEYPSAENMFEETINILTVAKSRVTFEVYSYINHNHRRGDCTFDILQHHVDWVIDFVTKAIPHDRMDDIDWLIYLKNIFSAYGNCSVIKTDADGKLLDYLVKEISYITLNYRETVAPIVRELSREHAFKAPQPEDVNKNSGYHRYQWSNEKHGWVKVPAVSDTEMVAERPTEPKAPEVQTHQDGAIWSNDPRTPSPLDRSSK